VLDLLVEMLRSPAFPESEFDQVIEQEVASWEDARNSPWRRASIALSRHMDPWPADDVRYTPLPDEALEMIQAVRLADVEAFHVEYYGATNGEMAIVGDFDPDLVGARLAELFEGFDSKATYERLEMPYRERPAIVQSVETPDKENAFCFARLLVNASDTHADYPALVLGSYIAGGGFLNSRITTRLRQQDGLSYGAGARFSAGTYDERGAFSVFASYAPENDEMLLRGIREEIERMVADGFTAEEVEEAKSGWLQQRQISRGVERELAGLLANRLFENRTLAWDAETEVKIAGLTPEALHDAFRRHIDPDRLSIVRAGDFGYEEPEQASTDEPETRPGKPSM
jgi:zinc protease